MSEIHIKGLQDLQKFLDTLPAKVEKNIMRSSLRAGAKVLQAEAKANVPVRSGKLRDSLKIGTRARGGRISASVRTKLWYAKWVEYGTAAHNIAAKKGESLSFGGIFAETVAHPGARAKPFMRPAMDMQAGAAVNEAARYMRERLQSKHGLETSGVMLEGDE